MDNSHKRNPASDNPIAIIGIGCRLPGEINRPEVFWKFLAEGRDAITEIPEDRWNADKFYAAKPGIQGKYCSRSGGFVRNIQGFDSGFFGISPREAKQMDPHQKILLEVSWQAIEDAGLAVDGKKPVNAGVFVGISNQDYGKICQNLRELETLQTHHATGISFCIASNRLSHFFNFVGPSFSLDTACSSSLVAVHLACMSLKSGECDFALAGGANIILNPETYVSFSNLSMLSPDGRCYAFDARANGYVRSEGAGMVVLMPLSKAIIKGHDIYAVIERTGINQDGSTPGITVPNGRAQENLMEQIYRDSGIDPGLVSFIEAHGTGTRIGDPVEAKTIGKIIGSRRPSRQPCFLGSLKTNIGHLESAAGVAGLIKAALVLRHKKIPPNLHFVSPNPKIDFRKLRLKIPLSLLDWPKDYPLYAAVNSFGFGGTNAHAVLSAAPEESEKKSIQIGGKRGRTELFCLSAHTDESLRVYTKICQNELKRGLWKDWTLNEICGRSWKNRAHLHQRLCAAVDSKKQLQNHLSRFQKGETAAGMSSGRIIPEKNRKIVFVFSGQGPQWWGMGRELFQAEPVFRRTINRCHELLSQYSPWSLLEELQKDEKNSRLHTTSIAQPAITAVQIALAELWKSWGIRPDAVVGHSVGEVAAAWAAGVLTFDDALKVIYHRGRCMEKASALPGKMLAVSLSSADIRAYLKGYEGFIHVGAVNSPESVTLSGDSEPMEDIEKKLSRDGVFSRPLRTGYAFHSHHMDGLRPELVKALEGLQTCPPKLPVYSTVRGGLARAEDFLPDYWWKNVREQVKFEQAVHELIRQRYGLFIELSPHPVLSSSISESLIHYEHPAAVLPSLRRNSPERFTMLASLGRLFTQGVKLKFKSLYSRPAYRAKFPPYAWNRDPCWQIPGQIGDFLFGSKDHPLLGTQTSSPTPMWETQINDVLFPFLRDHVIHNSIVLPSSVYLEIALTLALEHMKYEFAVLKDVHLEKAAFLFENTDLTLKTSYDDEELRFKIHTPETDRKTWRLNGFGTILPPQEHQPRNISPDRVRTRFRKKWSQAQCYKRFKNVGIDYGPDFRGISTLYLGRKEALAEIVLPEGVRKELRNYRFHPLALDMCLQAIRGIIYKEITWIPIRFKRVQFFKKPAARMWSHVHHVKIGRETLEASITVSDRRGSVLAEIEGILLKGFEAQAVQKAPNAEDLLYNSVWIQAPDSHSSNGRPQKSSRRDSGIWLIFYENRAKASQLIRNLVQRGEKCISISHGPRFEQIKKLEFKISTASRSDLNRLFRTIFEQGHARWKGIVRFCDPETPPLESLSAPDFRKTAERQVLNTLFLLQEAVKHESKISPKLFLVSRGAQSAGENPEPVFPLQALIWGLGRVIINEFPRFQTRLIDLDPTLRTAETSRQEMDLLSEEVMGKSREDEIVFRQNKRYIHRIKRTLLSTTFPPQKKDRTFSEANFLLETLQPGTLEALHIRKSERLVPKKNEVEIEVNSVGLNFSDVLKALNLYPGMEKWPVPLGSECAGVVSRAGEGVQNFREGDRVIALSPHSFTAYLTAPEGFVLPLPEGLSFDQGATLPLAYLTAHYSLICLGNLKKNERVLIHSASGGVGMAAIQIARHIGAEIFATAGTPEKRRFLKALGIRQVLDSRSLSFADDIRKQTKGEGVDVVLNSLSGRAIDEGISVLRDNGRFLEIGKRDIHRNKRIGLGPFQNNLSFHSIDLDKLIQKRSSTIEDVLKVLSRRFSEKIYSPLPHNQYKISQAEDAFRQMAQAKHIGKIVVSTKEKKIDAVQTDAAPIELRPDASYLVTGGFGGFGLTLARWMVNHGARHIALMGRRGAASSSARQTIRDLENTGAKILEIRGDVGREKDVRRAFASIRDFFPELRGLVHCAVVLEDEALVNMTPAGLKKVLDPKVAGAWFLHRQTQKIDLDFFVLFSSVSSLMGMPGQGSYAAANSFLDGLSKYRHFLGLPGSSINWGYLGEVGVAARNRETARRLENYGLRSIPPVLAMDFFSRFLASDSVQVAVLDMDWSRFRKRMKSYYQSPKFSNLWTSGGEKTGIKKTTEENLSFIRESLISADERGRFEILKTALLEQVSKILGISPSKLDIDKSLTELGFDSLMAVELRNWVESCIGVYLPTLEIMRGPSVKKMTFRLQAALTRKNGRESKPPVFQR